MAKNPHLTQDNLALSGIEWVALKFVLKYGYLI